MVQTSGLSSSSDLSAGRERPPFLPRQGIWGQSTNIDYSILYEPDDPDVRTKMAGQQNLRRRCHLSDLAGQLLGETNGDNKVA